MNMTTFNLQLVSSNLFIHSLWIVGCETMSLQPMDEIVIVMATEIVIGVCKTRLSAGFELRTDQVFNQTWMLRVVTSDIGWLGNEVTSHEPRCFKN